MENNIVKINRESESIKYLLKKEPRFKILYSLIGDLEYCTYNNSYVFLLNEIIGQMLSNKVAKTISNRLLVLCNNDINPEKINNISDEDLRSIGISYSKISYIKNLTIAVMNKKIVFSELKELNNTDVIKRLQTIKGIGNWTAKMYLIFVLDRNDIIPFEDMAFTQGYAWFYNTKKIDKKSIMSKSKAWEKYASILARYLYKAVDLGYIKKPFKQYN